MDNKEIVKDFEERVRKDLGFTLPAWPWNSMPSATT